MAADISKTRQTLNWQPRVDFAEGMKRTVRWASILKEDQQ
jgi:nucleoside-diphosphate-sugar epimerase